MSNNTATSFEFTKEGFQALVAKVIELENKLALHTASGTVSPPPGMVVNDRTRSYSNNSSGSNSSEISSLENFNGDSSKFTQMPCKPKYGEIVCSALLDGWLIHGNTYDHKDMIKENGAKWFGKCKGWALNDKTAVARILKKINIQKKLEKVQNSFQNLGLRFYKPIAKKDLPQPLSDEEKQEESATLDTFLDVKKDNNTSTCMIDESDDDEEYDISDNELSGSDNEE